MVCLVKLTGLDGVFPHNKVLNSDGLDDVRI